MTIHSVTQSITCLGLNSMQKNRMIRTLLRSSKANRFLESQPQHNKLRAAYTTSCVQLAVAAQQAQCILLYMYCTQNFSVHETV